MAKNGAAGCGANPRATTATWMSLKEASELTGRSRAELRGEIAAGALATRTIRCGDKVEHRLTRAALAEAGLIGATPATRDADAVPVSEPVAETSPETSPDTMAQLIALIREQNQRIATLEDQRAQLAARLGATVEAMHQLEDRLEVILDARAVPETPSATDALPVMTADGLVIARGGGPPASPVQGPPTQLSQLTGVRRSLSRLVREVAQPRLREMTGGPRREAAPGD